MSGSVYYHIIYTRSYQWYIFNEIFEPLTMILTEPNNLKKALTFHEYEAFIEFLSGCL